MAAARKRRVEQKESGAVVVQPASRYSTTWTNSLIRAAEYQAQSGDLRLAGQLCEWLLGDDRIARALHKRAQALLGLEPTFEASGDKRSSKRVVRALEGQDDWWDGWPEPVLTEMVVWGILLGVGFARHRWETLEGHGGRWLPRPANWEAQHCRYDFNQRTWITRVHGAPDEAFQPGDGTWIVHAPYGTEKPQLRGLWRGLARFRLLRDHAVEDLDRLGEDARRNVVETDKDAKQTPERNRQLAEDLSNLGRDGTVVLPPGMLYKILTAGEGTVAVYQEQFKVSELAIDIAISGGNLTTNVEGGSRAAAEVQERTGEQANLKFDAQCLTTTVHDQSMVWWAEYNFGSQELAPWPVYPVEPEEDLKVKTETEGKAFENVKAAEDLGFDVDREKFLEENKITWAKPGTKPEPPKPPAGADPSAVPVPGQPGQAPAPPSKQGAKPATARAQSGTGITARLASGFLAAKANGFLNGQLYADALTEHATADGEAALQPTLDAVLEELEAATDYDDLRERLRNRYAQLDPEALTELTFKAMLMAEIAGRAAAKEDE